MGDTSSAWSGVTYDNTAGITTGNTYGMTGVYATNTQFVAQSTTYYTDSSFFYGQIDYSSSDAWVEVIRQTPRQE